jgi:hypothetical protein
MFEKFGGELRWWVRMRDESIDSLYLYIYVAPASAAAFQSLMESGGRTSISEGQPNDVIQSSQFCF